MSEFISGDQLFRYVPRTNTFERIPFAGLIESVFSHNDKVYIIDSDRHMWAMGVDSRSIRGFENSMPGFTRVPGDTEFKSVSDSGLCAVALDIYGNIWYKGEISRGYPKTEEFTQFTDGTQYVDVSYGGVSYGGDYCLAIDATGDLWGCGNDYNLVLGNGGYINNFDKIKVNAGYKKVCCGNNMALCIDINGDVWGSGIGIKTITGQMSNGFVKISEGLPIKNISVDSGRILFLSEDNRVFTRGLGLFGQIGEVLREHQGVGVYEAVAENIVVDQINMDKRRVMLKDVDGNIWIAGSYSRYIDTFQMLEGINVDSLSNQPPRVVNRFLATKRALPRR